MAKLDSSVNNNAHKWARYKEEGTKGKYMFFDDEPMGAPTDGGTATPADDTTTDTEEKEEGGETAAM